jgi:hypothetical protein
VLASIDEVIEQSPFLLRCMSQQLALNGPADPTERCLLLEAKQKTFALGEYFAF